ncbi:glycosyltransferase [Rhodocytophaga rosea]|uniref:Glycosyltransferase n=1 Tax=Rhodocytophaga rosea TaxID=2704465 RepID=A0A6C0GSN7_9BACT|nr:glycosyltransferase family 2 protein [Rhodocytophaga rosea]QHT71145.1 glycosyltransferase [Rhodocytophaga rosea]
MPESPLISIITVTYNAASVLEATIQSVIGQNFRNFEYIIIDGASTDGTLEIIRKYGEHISYWVSEPDKGLYDAMNKGLKAAKGKYVWFMNAGDKIYNKETLKLIFSQSMEADVLYGDALFFQADGKENGLRSQVTPHQLPANLNWKSLQYGMVVCHQSFIVKKEIAPLYDLSHPYSADVDWEIQCLKHARDIVHTGLVLCRYLTGGFSKKHLYRSLADRFDVLRSNYGIFQTLKSHVWITIRGIFFVLKRKKGY